MIDMFVFLATLFLFIFLVGRLLEKIKVPWIFSALVAGFLLAIYNPFISITSSFTFEFLAQLGMFFLLFIIGFEMNLGKLRKLEKFIFKATFFIIFLEAVLGALLIHFVFGYTWLISFLVALSFATVGEAILIHLLDRFGIVDTKFGQSIIGIGSLNDILEILLLVFVVALIDSNIGSGFNVMLSLGLFVALIILAISFIRLEKEKFRFLSIEFLFLFLLFALFLFVGIGKLAHAAPIAALMAGVVIKRVFPKNKIKKVELGVKMVCYGFFAPIFFLWIGLTMDINYLFKFPLLVFLVAVISTGVKILGAWLIGKKELGTKQSILLGIGLSVRFSTGIIIMKILLDNALIEVHLFSIIVASSVVLKFVVPGVFSRLIVKWGVVKNGE